MPLVSSELEPRDWPLSEDGRGAARRLAAELELPADVRVVSSDELKARQTAELFSARVAVDPRLREVRRPWIESGYQGAARSWLEGEKVADWESQLTVINRMTAAVKDAVEVAGVSTRCLVSHGLAISVLIAEIDDIDPVGFWSRRQFPGHVRLDLGRFSAASLERRGTV